MERSGPTILKLGGSLLTRKREEARLRPKLLRRLSEEIAGSPTPLVLLHGAGSFGHHGATRAGLASPPSVEIPEARRRRGAVLVAAQVRQLHVRVLQALADAGVPAFSVPAGATALNRAGRPESLDPAPFLRALELGVVPVSFGDVVPDLAWGFSILSADTIALRLAAPLGARRVLFASDVEGVLEFPDGAARRPRVLRRVDRSTLATLQARPGAPDVTGGIRGKLETVLALAEGGVDAGIISGLRHGTLARALTGEEVHGSWAGPSFH